MRQGAIRPEVTGDTGCRLTTGPNSPQRYATVPSAEARLPPREVGIVPVSESPESLCMSSKISPAMAGGMR
jgi:hypothetical protein